MKRFIQRRRVVITRLVSSAALHFVGMTLSAPDQAGVLGDAVPPWAPRVPGLEVALDPRRAVSSARPVEAGATAAAAEAAAPIC